MRRSPRFAAHPMALLAGLAILAGASSGCASDGCTAGESTCDGRVAKTCGRHDSDGPFASSYTEWATDDCGSPDRCVIDPHGWARCTLAPPLPSACAEQGGAWSGAICQGSDLIRCHRGLAVHRVPCAACRILPGPNQCANVFEDHSACESQADCQYGPAACLPVSACSGALFSHCQADPDCAAGLNCRDGICTRPCGCPDPAPGALSSTCFDCRDDLNDPVTTSFNMISATLYNVCRAGWCRIETP